MLLRPLTLAATAAALVIIPQVSHKDESIFRTLPAEADSFQLPTTVLSQSVEIPCLECSGSDPVLHFSVDIEAGRRLVLNGFELYPHADPWHGDLLAQLDTGSGKKQLKRLGYSLAAVPQSSAPEDYLQLIDVEIRIIEVGELFVDNVPPMNIRLVKIPTGDILIGNIEMIEPKQKKKKPCKSATCVFQARLSSFWASLKSLGICDGKLRGHLASHRVSGSQEAAQDQVALDRYLERLGRLEDENQGMHENRSWFMLIRNVAAYVFLPIFLGMVAGVGIACFSVVIGTAATKISKFIGCGRRRQTWSQTHRKSRTTEGGKYKDLYGAYSEKYVKQPAHF